MCGGFTREPQFTREVSYCRIHAASCCVLMEVTGSPTACRQNRYGKSTPTALPSACQSQSLRLTSRIKEGRSGLATLESQQIVIWAQFLRCSQRLVTPTHCSHGALVLSSRRSFALLAGNLSSIAVKRLNSSLGKAKYRRSSRTASASRHAVSSMKSDRFLPSTSAAHAFLPFFKTAAGTPSG